MALNVAKGTVTQPGSTGTQTITLAGGFNPQLVLLWGVVMAADGDSASTRAAEISYGAGSYRGSTVQQWYILNVNESGDQGVAHTARASNTDAILRFVGEFSLDAAQGTPMTSDCVVTLDSMTSSTVVLNWTNLHTIASIVVHYVILGGSDLSDALVGSNAGSGGSTTLDVDVSAATGGSGWTGKPSLVHCATNWEAAGDKDNDSLELGLGWGNQVIEQFCSTFGKFDGAGTMQTQLYQRSGKILTLIDYSGETADYDVALAAVASWPSTGFQLTLSASTTDRIYWVALKGSGSFTSKVGAITTATGTGDQDTALGFAANGAILWGGSMAPSASLQTSGTDLVAYHIQGTDGTNHGSAAYSDDDGNANERGRMSQKTDGVELVTNAGGAISRLLVGTPSFSGNNLRINWSTINATGREVLYVAFGGATAAAPTSLLFQPFPATSSLYSR